MIFGKTKAEKEKIQTRKDKRLWFAWYPVHFRKGHWGWLEYVHRESNFFRNGSFYYTYTQKI